MHSFVVLPHVYNRMTLQFENLCKTRAVLRSFSQHAVQGRVKQFGFKGGCISSLGLLDPSEILVNHSRGFYTTDTLCCQEGVPSHGCITQAGGNSVTYLYAKPCNGWGECTVYPIIHTAQSSGGFIGCVMPRNSLEKKLFHPERMSQRRTITHLACIGTAKSSGQIVHQSYRPVLCNNLRLISMTQVAFNKRHIPTLPQGRNLRNTVSNFGIIKKDGMDKERHILIFQSELYEYMRYYLPLTMASTTSLALVTAAIHRDYLEGFPFNIDSLDHPAVYVCAAASIAVCCSLFICAAAYVFPWRLYYDILTGKYTFITSGRLLVNMEKIEFSISELYRARHPKEAGLKVGNRLFIITLGKAMDKAMIREVITLLAEVKIRFQYVHPVYFCFWFDRFKCDFGWEIALYRLDMDG